MVKKTGLSLLFLMVNAHTALCDWDRHSHHSANSLPDPAFDSFMWTCIFIIAASIVILTIGLPILAVKTRRLRDMLLVVLLVNTIVYMISISLRPYPGGFAARFQSPNLLNTILEIILLLAAGVIVAVLLAAFQWMLRIRRKYLGKEEKKDTPGAEI